MVVLASIRTGTTLLICATTKKTSKQKLNGFFATSHGKRACDRIGGTVKRLVAKKSLRRPYDKQILTPFDMRDYCKENIKGITFMYIPVESIKHNSEKLKERFQRAVTIKGTQ